MKKNKIYLTDIGEKIDIILIFLRTEMADKFYDSITLLCNLLIFISDLHINLPKEYLVFPLLSIIGILLRAFFEKQFVSCTNLNSKYYYYFQEYSYYLKWIEFVSLFNFILIIFLKTF